MFYLPSKKSLKLALAGDLFDPLTTAKLSRVGLEPNLSRMLEQERNRSESVTAPVRKFSSGLVFRKIRSVCLHYIH